MTGWARVYGAAAAFAGLAAVIMAALAAHALPARAVVPVQSAVRMQGWHALALLIVALWVGRMGGPRVLHGAAWCFIAGMVLFSGAIYLAELGGVRLGPVAPVGGVLLMLGWVLLGVAAVTSP